jgi:hypothetical protein
MRKLHVAAQTSRVASVRVTPWEGARPRPARGPDAKAAVRCAARVGEQERRDVASSVTRCGVAQFDQDLHQKFELKCTEQ